MRRLQLLTVTLLINYIGYGQPDTTIIHEDTTMYNGINYTDQQYEVVCFAPNAITTDGNARNEEWLPVLINNNPWKFQVIIYDRYGLVVWESYDQSVAWDGMFNGVLVTGTYVWHIVTNATHTDKIFQFTGFITVIR
jgi:gliding motility-associated-like protein